MSLTVACYSSVRAALPIEIRVFIMLDFLPLFAMRQDAVANSPASSTTVRKNFPETWIWSEETAE